MPKRSIVLLAAGAIAGGCSRDAPLMAPQIDSVDPVVAPSLNKLPELDSSTVAVESALGRLVPALEEHGAAVRAALLKLETNRSDAAARNELSRVLDLLDSTLPEQYHADLDALRLELDVPVSTSKIKREDSHD